MARACERCEAPMAQGRPRVRVGGKQLWCQTCAKDASAPSGRYRPGTDIAKEAVTCTCGAYSTNFKDHAFSCPASDRSAHPTEATPIPGSNSNTCLHCGHPMERDPDRGWYHGNSRMCPKKATGMAKDPHDYSQCVSRRDDPSLCLWHGTDHLTNQGDPNPNVDGHLKPHGGFDAPRCDLCNGFHDSLHHYSQEPDHPDEGHALRGIPMEGSLTPTVLGITSTLRRSTASDDDFAAHFNDQMKGTEGEALGGHLWDGMAKAMGFEDGDHMHVARQNRDHETLAKRYEGQPGKMGMDENGEPHYEIHHPSGWIGRMNVGPYMDISHKATPSETHEILDVGKSDSNGHVLHESMRTDDPLVNHHRAHWALHNFAKEHGDEYADNIPKVKSWMGRRGLTSQGSTMGIQRLAHDSGDGETIYHCPFCGSGQVIARSDGTIDCEFCHTMFTVQVQPEYPAFPQTINGAPVQVPGMPGQIDSPVGAQPDPNAPMDPSQVGGDPAADPGADPAAAGADAGGDDFAAPASASNQPPWLKGSSLVTVTGARLDPEDFVAHLAIKHAPDKAAVIEQVRARRKS